MFLMVLIFCNSSIARISLKGVSILIAFFNIHLTNKVNKNKRPAEDNIYKKEEKNTYLWFTTGRRFDTNV